MRNLSRHRHAVTSAVALITAAEPGPDGHPDCCGGWQSVKARVSRRLLTVHCPECVPAPSANVLDDIEREDDEDGENGYEPEDHLLRAVA